MTGTIRVADYDGDWNNAIAAVLANNAHTLIGEGTYPITEPIVFPDIIRRLDVDFCYSLFRANGYNGTVVRRLYT